MRSKSVTCFFVPRFSVLRFSVLRFSVLRFFVLWSLTLGCVVLVCRGAETREQRRERLATMSSAEKDELLRKQQRLTQLKPEQQEQLRGMERQLAQDPQGDRLRIVMLRYHEWLRSLPTAERAELLSLRSRDEQIARIKTMYESQETERLRELAKASLTPEDVEQVRAWFGELVLRRKSELLQLLPEHIRVTLAETNEPRRLVYELSNQFRDKSKPPQIRIMESLQLDEAERQRLVEKLSAQARDVYRRPTNDQDKQTVLQNWVFATMMRPRMPSSDELRELLNNLGPEERDRIENLPPEQMQAELKRYFFFHRMPRWSPDGKGLFPGDGFKGGDPRKRPTGKPRDDLDKPDK